MTDRNPNKNKNETPYKQLPESFKGRYAFTLAAPSFIYPDHILPNVRMLAPFVDEIELVLFESAPEESLPTAEEIEKLALLRQTSEIKYNIHLPIDVSITATDEKTRTEAINRISIAVDRARHLIPSTWTLHLPYTMNNSDTDSVKIWQNLARNSAEALLEKTRLFPRSVSIENLDFPPIWLKPVAENLDLSVCLDIGHLMEHGYGIKENFKVLENRISIIHLYGGVKAGRGHVGLDRLPEGFNSDVSYMLSQFTGTVSLEVFSGKDLEKSLKALTRLALHDKSIVP